jgi:cyclic pyranopterin phosphate synthase
LPDAAEEERTHVCIGAECNNNCVFCMEDDREARRRALKGQTAEDVLALILRGRGRRELLFTTGEPTLEPRLPRFVRAAVLAGFGTVGVITNGRRFSDPAYAEQLVRAGLGSVTVSLHGPDARLHDALTRTRGSFEQTLAGLRNLCGLRNRFPLRVQTSTVVCRRNLDAIGDLCRLFGTLDADRHVFNVMQPDGRGDEFFDSLMPRYRDVSRVFHEILPELEPGFLDRLALVDIPPCCTQDLPATVRGHVQRTVQYEPKGALENRIRQRFEPLAPPEADPAPADVLIHGSAGTFEQVTRTRVDALTRSKRSDCAACRFDATCRGVWVTYLRRFGWEEFLPAPSQD